MTTIDKIQALSESTRNQGVAIMQAITAFLDDFRELSELAGTPETGLDQIEIMFKQVEAAYWAISSLID